MLKQKGALDSIPGLNEYVLTHSLRETDILKRLRAETEKDVAAIMQIPPDQGQFMALLVQLMGARKTIEIGVYTGYSTLCVAQAMPEDSYTVACDINKDWTSIAQKYWREAGIDNKIDLRLAPAVETLKDLINNGQSGCYDFIFIDADKNRYDEYYELSLQLLRQGGLLAIDNVLLFGSVIKSEYMDESIRKEITEESIQAVRDLNTKIKDDPRVEISMLKIADGLTLAVKQ